MRRSTFEIVLALFFIFSGTLFGRTFVVSTGGNDGNAGTLSAPWRTLGKANATLGAGDTVLVRAGTYHERIAPSLSGASGSPLVYRAFPGEMVIIDGADDANINVVAIYRSWVIIEGFTFNNSDYFKLPNNTDYWVILEGTHNTFRYNRLVVPGDVFNYMYTQNATSRGIAEAGQYNTIEHCYIRGVVFGIVIAGSSPRYTTVRYDTVNSVGQNCIDVGSTADGTTAYHGTLIEYCVLDTSFIEDNIQFEPDYGDPTTTLHNRGTIIRHNVMGNAAENAIDLKGAGHTIIEDNLLYSSSGDDDGPIGGHDTNSGGGLSANANTPTRNTIVRRNVIWDHNTGLDMAEGDHYYNNTILNNRRTWAGPNQTDGSHAGVMAFNYPNVKRAFLNNIIGAQPNAGVFNWLMDWGDKFHLDNNLYFDRGAAVKFNHRVNGNTLITSGLANWKNTLGTYGGYAYMKGKDGSSIEAEPAFVNVPAYPSGYDPAWNFGLSAGSPAIDAGTAVTVATAGGSNSTTLSVDDAYFFYDGFGITQGDDIRIGGGSAVRISSVDYANNTLTLSEPRTWTSGAGVTPAYSGNAPDIGAFESGGSAVPPTSPPASVQPTVPADGATGVLLQSSLSWTAASTAVSYQIQVSAGSAFTSNAIDASGILGTSYPISTLAAGTVYFWRVRGVNQGGAGSWSGVRSFTTAPTAVVVVAPGAVQLSVPVDGANGILLASSLTWTATSTAVAYQVQVSVNSAFPSTIIDASGVTATSYALTSLSSGTVYYWRVRASNAGGPGPWSGVRTFTTVSTTGGTVVPAAVQPALPANGATGIVMQSALTWAATSTAVTYQVQISVGAAFSNNAIDVSGVTVTSYSLSALAGGTVYYWRVRAANTAGNGPWSTVRSFTTAPTTGGSEGTNTQLLRNNDFEAGTQEWTFFTGGVGSFVAATPGYSGSSAAHITIATIDNNIQLFQQGISLNAGAYYKLSFAAYSPSGHDLALGLLQNTSPFTNYGLQSRKVHLTKGWRTYTIYLQAKNFSGTVTDARLQFGFQSYAAAGDEYWLDALQLQQTSAPALPNAPAFILPVAAAVEQSTVLTINWAGSEGIDQYRVQLARDPSFSSLVCDTVVVDTLVQVGPLAPATRYFRRVCATNITGTGPFTTPSFFTTAKDQPDPSKRDVLPSEIQLDQNYPNPFNPATVIRYRLPAQTQVSLIIYNTLGAEVAKLVDAEQPEGEHSVSFDGTGLPTGAYFCRLRANGVLETRKMILTR